MARLFKIGSTWYRQPAAGQAAFPSRLQTSGQALVDANGFVMPQLKGFNVQIPVNGWASSHFSAMAAEAGVTSSSPGLIRMCIFWEQFEVTGPNATGTGPVGTNSNGHTAAEYAGWLDAQVASAVANNFYVYMDLHLLSIHFPSWASTVTTNPSHSAVNYQANGHNITDWIAARYGNPANPQGNADAAYAATGQGKYTPAVLGFGLNEPAPPQSDYNTAPIQANIAGVCATAAQWVRNQAPNWICGIGGTFGTPSLIHNASGSGQTTQTYTNVSATPLAGLTGGVPTGNFWVDVHDEWMGLTSTSTPVFDGRGTDGRPGNTEIKLADVAYDRYPPLISGVPVSQAILRQQQAALWAAAKAYCAPSYANCPILMGEHGWQAVVDSGGGQAAYLNDKFLTWNTLPIVARCQWDYGNNQATDGWCARPGAGTTGADSNGWQTWTNLAF